MKILARQSTSTFFGLIACLLSACTIYLEITAPGLKTALFLIPPAFLIMVCFAYRLSPPLGGFRHVLFSKNSFFVLAYLLSVAVLTFTPIDDIFHRTWVGRSIPVSVWLSVSLTALGSVFAFLLYILEGHGKNIITRIAGASGKNLESVPCNSYGGMLYLDFLQHNHNRLGSV